MAPARGCFYGRPPLRAVTAHPHGVIPLERRRGLIAILQAARVSGFVVTAVEDGLQVEHDIRVTTGQGDMDPRLGYHPGGSLTVPAA